MTLCDELYFDVTLSGAKSEIRKFAAFLRSGELDDFFEISTDYISYDDAYDEVDDDGICSMTFSNDDWGIEIEELDVDEFLDVFCRAARKLEVKGTLYDADDDEFSFVSYEGDSYYINARNIKDFNDELDAHADKEEREED